jgi:signal peptide peptidase SppA
MLDLPHIASRIFGVPLLIDQRKLNTILEAIGPRVLLGEPLQRRAELPAAPATRSTRSIANESGIAIVPIIGTLVHRVSWLDAESGMVGYAGIEADVRNAMADSRVRGVMLEVDSPGGEVAGCFDLADRLRAIADDAGKPIWAAAADMACSAGYALASAADQIWVTRTGMVGSVGVVATHVDQSGADTKAGLRYSFIAKGARKLDGNSHAPLSDEARTSIETDLEKVYGLFVDLVADRRGLSAEHVRGTEAQVYMGQDALDIGLADAIGSLDDAIREMASTMSDGRGSAFGARAARSNQEPSMEKTAAAAGTTAAGTTKAQGQTEAAPPAAVAAPPVAAAPAAPATATASPEQLAAAAAAAATTAATERAAEIVAIAEQARRMGVVVDVPKALRDGVEPAALRKAVIDKAAETDRSSAITAAAASPDHAGAGKSGAAPRKAKLPARM